MPTVALKVTRPAPSGGEHRPPEIVRPLFRGSGDTDYLCGDCAAVIASAMGPTQRVNVDVVGSGSAMTAEILLDALGILKGVAWKQFAYLNAFWAALAIVFVYGFARRLTGSVMVALLTALFHLGCGTFLLLGVINEDIMPGYELGVAGSNPAGDAGQQQPARLA